MAEDLERLMLHARGEGPSAEFVAKLRERIVEETTPSGESSEVETVVDLDRRDLVKPPTVPRRLLGLTVAAAVVVIAGAIIGIAGPELSMTADEPASFAADSTLLTDEFLDLEAGTYLIDTVGTSFSLSFDQQHFVPTNSDGRVVVTHRNSQDQIDRTIEFTRLSALADPVTLTSPAEDSEHGWPARDFDGWLDDASAQLLVSNRRATTLGGLPAIRVDLELDETDCRPGVDRCMFLGSNRLVHDVSLLPGLMYRVWVVEQGEEDPLVVVATINRDTDAAWFETADMILSSLAFGEIGPNPALPVSAGSAQVPFLGGIRIELGAESVVLGDPGGIGRVPLGDWNAATGFLANPLDIDGDVLAAADDVLTALGAADVEVVELEGTTIGGFDARAFDVSAEKAKPALLMRAMSEREWLVPPRGRIWLIEHPDRGLLMITAQVFENLDLVFPLVATQTEGIIESLEFTEAG